jgi:hypothetical protein
MKITRRSALQLFAASTLAPLAPAFAADWKAIEAEAKGVLQCLGGR